MKITTVETFVLGNRSGLVKISTDEGIAGWGDCTLENWVRTSTAAVERMAEHLVGRDPSEITRLWQLLARGGYYRGGPVLSSAVAGIDQALWDIKGRTLGVGVHELLGGPTRDWIRAYAHANAPGRTGDPGRAREQVAAGMSVIKVSPEFPIDNPAPHALIESIAKDLAALRDALGPAVEIAIDLHGRTSFATARALLSAIEPAGIAFVEEPVPPDAIDLLGRITRDSPIPIAVGERLYTRAEFRRVLDAGVAIIQPDVSHAGGITECLRIAALAETYDAVVAPHCPLGPVALAASLQLVFAITNGYRQEQTVNAHLSPSPVMDIIVDPAPVIPTRDGRFARPPGPGLGIDVDEAAVRRAVLTGPLAPGSPTWTHDDGSFAEW